MSVFRLIHLSDIHLTPFVEPSLFELCSKRVTGWLNWRLNRAHGLGEHVLKNLVADMQQQKRDHLVISGDLVNLALRQEFLQARHWLEQLGLARDVSLIFGNHDAYVPGALKKACQIFAPWIEGDDKQSKMPDFPYCRQRGEVAIIGVNSAYATRPFSARGFFKRQQALQLAEILAKTGQQDQFRVVMIHHPPLYRAVSRHKALQGIDLFQQIIEKQGAELILHGHSHLPSLNFIAGKNSLVPVVGVASASQGLGGHKPPANMNIFEISKQEKRWQCTLIRRTLIDATGSFDETQRHIFADYS